MIKDLKYYSYIKNTDDEYLLKTQYDYINGYINSKDITITKNYTNEDDLNKTKTDDYLHEVIDKLSFGATLILAGLEILGDTVFKIISTINLAKTNGITLHLVNENMTLYLQNNELFGMLSFLYKIEKKNRDNKVTLAIATRKKNKTETGRKSGKKTKSMFDKHKVKILKLHEQEFSKAKILKVIKEDDYKKNKDASRLIKSTPQALGNYIKKITTEAKRKLKIERSYIENGNKTVPSFDSGINLMNLDGTFSLLANDQASKIEIESPKLEDEHASLANEETEKKTKKIVKIGRGLKIIKKAT
jgi:hypothetical protein